MKKIIIFLFVILVSNLFSQQFQWYRNFPAEGRVATIDSSNNIYAFGIKDTTLFIIKYSPSGNLIWQRYAEGVCADVTNANFAVIDKQSNIYFTCQSLQRYALIKYDSSGNEKWVRYYDAGYCTPYGLAIDSSGFIYLTGEVLTSFYRIVTIKYNTQGDSLWTRVFDGGATYGCGKPHIFVSKQGEVFLGGFENTATQDFNYITFKYNTAGVIQWVSRFNGPANNSDAINSIKVDKDRFVFVTGGISIFVNKAYLTRSTIATIKYSPTGDTVWLRYPYGNFGAGTNEGQNVEVDSSSNVYTIGRISQHQITGKPSLWLSKYDRYGNTIWSFYDTNAFELNSSFLYNNKNLYLIGTRGGIMYSAIYDLQGNLLWNFFYPPTNNFTFYWGKSIFLDKNTNIYLTGAVGDTDSLFIYKFSTLPTYISGSSQNIASEYKLFQNYPNPFNPTTNIKYQLRDNKFVTLKVYDVLGREISILVNEKKKAGIYDVNFNNNNLSTGIYFYSLFIDGELFETKKMLLLK
jgi:hypothetical protein